MGVLYQPDPDRHLAVITIDRPEARNAVNGEVAQGIEDAIDQIEADDSIWVSIITGTPPVFCAGADLKEVGSGNARALNTKRGGFGGIVRRHRTKPIIAAVEGPALAGGTEIILACDLVVAGSTASFGLPEVKRSIVAGGGGLFRLGRRIPYAIAMEWALTGDGYPAQVAFERGLINEVSEPGQALERAKVLAARITANAPIAVQLSRKVMIEATYLDEQEGWASSKSAVANVAATKDFHEGVKAFIEKRPPEWSAS
ncbi:crotonase/enoyl-CoA hydratase family protein [Aeromicrobium ginsengisoli]|uniref:Crotonase/enoyl-CoA hydratase family protein n=1 Tax=Aeromicrobium ginsengisoli TaxID=363867 RepID=A0A5M4F9G7_9ACTN|nr:crotonase/enoyl-CoA hydratase family protein [Aeromicrobium ginsengisoli]KAA1394286.1 crotonase/enoyl-CoA hydratase family protein [Aeromicrobium ginsengisoli]